MPVSPFAQWYRLHRQYRLFQLCSRSSSMVIPSIPFVPVSPFARCNVYAVSTICSVSFTGGPFAHSDTI
jgi:hypothetical protein